MHKLTLGTRAIPLVTNINARPVCDKKNISHCTVGHITCTFVEKIAGHLEKHDLLLESRLDLECQSLHMLSLLSVLASAKVFLIVHI